MKKGSIVRRWVVTLVVVTALSFGVLLLLLSLMGGIPIRYFQFDLPGGYRCQTYRFSGCPPVLQGVVIEYHRGDIALYMEKYNLVAYKVGPNVNGYRVYPNVIVGHVTPNKAIMKPEEDTPFKLNLEIFERRLGYFIIDQHTKIIYGGLSKNDWMKKLKTYGITEEPKLHKPAWIDKYTGWNKPTESPAR